jgi:hypothetical protein
MSFPIPNLLSFPDQFEGNIYDTVITKHCEYLSNYVDLCQCIKDRTNQFERVLKQHDEKIKKLETLLAISQKQYSEKICSEHNRQNQLIQEQHTLIDFNKFLIKDREELVQKNEELVKANEELVKGKLKRKR